MNEVGIQKALFINKKQADSLLLEEAFVRLSPETTILKAGDVEKGIDILNSEKVDAVFVDYTYTKADLNFLQVMRKKDIAVPAIVIVEKGYEIEAAEVIKDGAYDFIVRDNGLSDSLPYVLDRIQNTIQSRKVSEVEHEQHQLLFDKIWKSQKWWQNIIDAIKDYLFVIDNDYRILRTNKAFSDLFGQEPPDIIMRPYYELFGEDKPHEWCVVPKDQKSSCPGSVERQIGEEVYLISCFPIFFDQHDAVVYIMKDITETRRLKDQIYHLDKLSSLGTLTSGVAHEINNPLTGIIGYTEMLLMNNQEDTTGKYLKNIYDAAIRCKRIVENMLTFSRQTPVQKTPENVNDIMDKTIELHEYWLKSTNIEIIKMYGQIPFINMDRQQMQQVILNLLINAEHALVGREGRGRIEISTEYDSDSKNIVIKIEDNGSGIPREILPKIFDPFFTTKPVNEGTGLGLSIAHGIIAEQGGTIEVESESGKGTAFTIRLPEAPQTT